LADTPTVVSYRVNPISAFLAQFLIKTKYVSLVNLILDSAVVPERLQDKAKVDVLSDDLLSLLTQNEKSLAQKKSFAELRDKLNVSDGMTPSQSAAQVILSLV